MDKIVSDEGLNKRRLPPWMVGIGIKEDNKLKKNKHEEGIVSEFHHTANKSNSRVKKKQLSQEEADHSSSLRKCETERMKRKLDMRVAGSDENIRKKGGVNSDDQEEEEVVGDSKSHQPDMEDGKRGKRKSSRRRRRKINAVCNTIVCGNDFDKENRDEKVRTGVKRSPSQERQKGNSSLVELESDDDETEIPSASEDDDTELTMEDLMTIAKEYVKDNTDFEQRPSGSHEAPQCSSFSPSEEETTCIYNLTANPTSERIVANPGFSGDPKQDMLNLFLGPLLKKPTEEEKKITSISEDRAFSYDYKPKNQKGVLGEDSAPLMKKKSSLKDKVGMFLN